MSYRRPLNFNEQLFFINSVFKHRDAVQVVVKLASSNLDNAVETLKTGITLASNAHKIHSRRINGSVLYLSKNNKLHIKVHYQDSELAENDALLNDPVKDSGTLIEHHIVVTKKNLFLIVKSHHVIMDGAAYVQYLKEIFKAIRGTSLISDQKLYSEVDAFPKNYTKTQEIQGPRASKVKGKWDSGSLVKVMAFDNNIGNLCAVLALSASKAIGRRGSFIIPFDLRKFGICPSGYGNMTLPIYLNVEPTDNLGDITAQLNYQVQFKAPLNNSLSSFRIKTIPNWLLLPTIKIILRLFQLTGYYFASGCISDLGKLSLLDFSAPDLDAVDLLPIPMVSPPSPYTAFCLSHENGTRIGLSVNAGNGLKKWEEEIQRLYGLIEPVLNDVGIDKGEPLDEVIVNAWARYLKLEAQHCFKNSTVSFSNFGGDSVALVLMCSEIQKALSMEGNQQVMSKIFTLGTSITISEMVKIYKQ